MCEWGDTVRVRVTVPAQLSYTGQDRRAVKAIDRCIAPIVRALNTAGIRTDASCCGHGKGNGSIILSDGRELVIMARKEKLTITVPNPDAPVRERLDTPSPKVHRSKKHYRRREKHQRPIEEEQDERQQ